MKTSQIKISIIYLLFLLSVFFINAQGQSKENEFNIEGKIHGADAGIIVLQYLNSNGKSIIDSADIIKNTFFFHGSISEPTISSISYFPEEINNNSDDNFLNIFLENGTIHVDLSVNDFSSAVISGSKTQQQFERLQIEKDVIRKKIREINKAITPENKREQEHLIMDLLYEKNKTDYIFISRNPNSILSAYCLITFHSNLSIDSLEHFFYQLSDEVKSSYYGKKIQKHLLKIKSNQIGKMAPDFKVVNIKGDTINLSDYYGNYVLLDFWASWCAPCRASNKKLKELFLNYHGNKFEIIGISLDFETKNWKKAVKEDSIFLWQQVLGATDFLKSRNGEINQDDIIEKYDVASIPYQILLDKEQRIIYKNNQDDGLDELTKKLIEIFK